MRFRNSPGSFAKSDGLVLADATPCSSFAVPVCWLVSAAVEGLCVAASIVKASVVLWAEVETAAPSAAERESLTTAALVFEYEAASV